MATVSPFALKWSAMFLALLRARSMTALSFWLTWIATLCWAPAAGLLGLLWAACLVLRQGRRAGHEPSRRRQSPPR